MRVLLIDADVLIYMAALNVEVATQWNEWLWTLHADFNAGVDRLEELLNDMQEELKADRMVMALSSYTEPNWRNSVLPSYKQHRKNARRPIIWRPLREYIEEKHETFMRPTLEGDDVLGILLTHPKLVKGEKIVVSIDKDMNTLPGLHLNHTRAVETQNWEGTVRAISAADADRFHLVQTIAGDSTDGYPGAPGWGMIRAERLLDAGLVLFPVEHTFKKGARKGETEIRWEEGGKGTPWEVVVSAYRSSGLNEEVALRNARVARICRHTDYDYEKKEVIPWHPNVGTGQ
jgi:hypothetical protein